MDIDIDKIISHFNVTVCATGVESYDSYDVLEDIEFKEGMKRFS